MDAAPDTDIAIPTRHGADLARSQRIARPIAWAVRGDPTPSPDRWNALGRGLMQGDPPMDRFVDWIDDHDMRAGRALFVRALEHGIDAVPDAPAPLRALFDAVEPRPRWLDERRLALGVAATHRTGMTGLRVLRDLSLMAGYQASAINKTLVATGSLERGPQRRIAETTKWWLDCTAPDGLERFGAGFRDTLHVRLVHALIRRRVGRQPDWRSDDWGLPVNQTDMAATQLGFSALFLLGVRALGVPLSHAEGDAVMHLWRYIGWLMGVDNEWLVDSEQAGRTLLYQILLSQAPPDESSRQLGRALMNEPLARHYPRFGGLWGRFDRARHLSITRLFVGARGMRDLGLPAWMPPWYPALALPANLVRQTSARLRPGGTQRLAAAGRRDQIDYLRVLFGDDAPAIHEPALRPPV